MIRQLFVAAILVVLSSSDQVLAERVRGIELHANGLDIFGWVPYSTAKIAAIPPVKLPNGERAMDFPATIINTPRTDKAQDFTLSIAADAKIDHTTLQLIARDAKNLTVRDFKFSVVSTPGINNQLITFVCSATGDATLIKQLVIVSTVPHQL